jgi:hypothetical protein
LREAHTEIEKLGARVIAIGTGADWQAQRLMDDGMPFPCLVDPEANLYRALDIGRMGWTDLLRPDLWRNYIDAFRHGGRQGRVTGDVRRLSGIAIIDPERTVRWLHRSATAGDYPPLAAVLTALADITRST